MLLGYNTNGFAHHRLEDALAIVAELGYGAIAITLDYHVLNPYDDRFSDQIQRVRKQLDELRLRSVIETGARFLLDPRRKHQPTLISRHADERQQRLDFLHRAVDIAAELGSDAVSFWSGVADECTGETPVPPGAADDEALYDTQLQRLVDGCLSLADHAAKRSVRLAFEPEPGMLIDTMDRFARLHQRIADPRFGLTMDIGHLHCQGETPIADHIRHWRDWLWNVHIDDMRRGVHDHLMFGEGEIEFAPVFAALREIDYSWGVYVELSRHSHNAVETARASLAFLNTMA